jgi:hypothetical protein
MYTDLVPTDDLNDQLWYHMRIVVPVTYHQIDKHHSLASQQDHGLHTIPFHLFADF